MKLYCVKIQEDEKITDVFHMLGNDNKEIHSRLDTFIEMCKGYGWNYNGYSFFEVGLVDGVNLSEQFFNKYKVVGNKIELV